MDWIRIPEGIEHPDPVLLRLVRPPASPTGTKGAVLSRLEDGRSRPPVPGDTVAGAWRGEEQEDGSYDLPAGDRIERFTNRYGEEWEFEYHRETGCGILRGSDIDWEEHEVFGGRVPELVLNEEELCWLRAVWIAATWERPVWPIPGFPDF